MSIDRDLQVGVAEYRARIRPLVGRTLTITTPDGRKHTGLFGEMDVCQPCITDERGHRFVISVAELKRLLKE